MAAMIACAFSPSNIKSENSYPFEDSSVVSKFTESSLNNKNNNNFGPGFTC